MHRRTPATTTSPHYQLLLQNRRANRPGESAWNKRLRTTTLHSKPDAAPNKRRPARRRLIASSPVNPLRSKFRAHQPRELTRRWQAALHRSGAKTPSNTYRYLRTGAPHPVPPHGPQNAVEALHPHHARTNLPLRPVATEAAMIPGHPLVKCVAPSSN